MLRDQLNQALKEAMKAREQRRAATIRLILAAVKDREIAARTEGDTNGIGDQEILQLLSKMVKQRHDSIDAYEKGGRDDLADQEREEIDVIQSFLPRQMDDTEIDKACRDAIEEVGAEKLKDIGKVMNVLKEKYPGRMDFSKASAKVKDLLS